MRVQVAFPLRGYGLRDASPNPYNGYLSFIAPFRLLNGHAIFPPLPLIRSPQLHNPQSSITTRRFIFLQAIKPIQMAGARLTWSRHLFPQQGLSPPN